MDNNINNHLTPEQIARCADAINKGTYKQIPASLRAHINECDQCAEEIINVSEISSDNIEKLFYADNQSKSGKKRTLKVSDKKLIAGIAASVIILAVALLLSFPDIINTNREKISSSDKNDKMKSQESIEKTEDSIKDNNNRYKIKEDNTGDKKSKHITKKNPAEKKMLASYEPNPGLEKLYKNTKGTYRGEITKIKTPSEINYNKTDSLIWENKSGKPLIIEIFDNKGEEILVDETNNEKYEIPDLSPGLYYWKLINKDFELLFVGKIIVYDNNN